MYFVLLKTILDLQGYSVEVLTDYGDLKKINYAPNLMILDAGELETMKGISECRRLKENSMFQSTKIIITSVVHDKELVLDSGADLYLPKPYELTTLIRWVDGLLKE